MSDPRDSRTVAVIGLGYVGLPLALAFGRVAATIGFDVDPRRVQALRAGADPNGESAPADFAAATRAVFTSDPAALAEADVFIVCVPTPVDAARRPDLGPLLGASRTVGEAIRARDPRRPVPIVVYESTVYPGCTEEDASPALEKASGKKRGEGFKLAYSPERVNPGDRARTLENVVKVVSAEDGETLDVVAALYGGIVRAGVHRAPTIRVAEAAKVIENTQRDINIALMNELAILFDRMGIDTKAVLDAAGTKWNFLPFRPGLVGGHCIPVDPYYLTHKAQEHGLHPQVILAGRRVNDGMPKFVADRVVQLIARSGRPVRGARVLMLGATFKENVSDTRNSGAMEVAQELRRSMIEVEAYDPHVPPERLARHGLLAHETPPFDGKASRRYDVVILAVAHDELREVPAKVLADLLVAPECGGIVDVRGVLDERQVREAGAPYWRL